MAGQKKVADVYSEVSFKWDKKSLKLLRQFKKEIMETRKSMQSLAKMRSGPAQKAAQNAIKSQTAKEKERNKTAAKNIKLLRDQAKLQKKLSQMPAGQEKATAASMTKRAREGFEKGKLTSREYDERMLKAEQKMNAVLEQQANTSRKAAKAETERNRERNQAASKNIKLLRTQTKLQKKIAQMPEGKEKQSVEKMSQDAEEKYRQGQINKSEYDERTLRAEQKASRSVDRADRRTKAAKMAREFREMSKGADLSDRKVQGLRQEMRRLNARMVKGQVSNKRYSASMATMRNQMKKTNATAKKSAMTFDEVRSNLVALTGAYTAFRGAAEVARIGQQFEKTRVLLGTLFGDKQQEMFAALSSEAERLGLNINQAAGSFAKYSVSAQALGFSNKQMMNQFTDLSEAAIVFGLSTEQQLGVFRAFEQIASKGTVNLAA